MSMILGLAMVNDKTIAKVLSNPPLVWKVLGGNSPEPEPQKQGSWFSKLFGKRPKLVISEEIDRPIEEIDLDKAWHGIHYLLTQTDWEGNPPLNFLLLGGEEIGDIDVGYGPARAITSNGVREIHSALSSIDEPTLKSRFNPTEMTKLSIYPDIWDRDPADDDTFGYWSEYFANLKVFVDRAADQGLGLVIYLS